MIMPWEKVKLCSVGDIKKKERIQELLACSGIWYQLKTTLHSWPHPADSAGIGTMAGVGNMRKTEQKNTYIFYVKKEDEEQARNLIKEA